MSDLEQSAAYCLGRSEAEMEYALTQATVEYLQTAGEDEDMEDTRYAKGFQDGLAAAVEILHDNLKRIGWRSDG